MKRVNPIDSEAGRPWAVESSSERFSEVVRLNVRVKTYGWCHIHIGAHLCAVLVIGADQAEAEDRAQRIVKAMNRSRKGKKR